MIIYRGLAGAGENKPSQGFSTAGGGRFWLTNASALIWLFPFKAANFEWERQKSSCMDLSSLIQELCLLAGCTSQSDTFVFWWAAGWEESFQCLFERKQRETTLP